MRRIKLDVNIVEAIHGIDYFSKMGQPTSTIEGFRCEFVPSAQDVQKSLDGMRWENFRLDRNGDITVFLSLHRLNKDWNLYAKAARAEIAPYVTSKAGQLSLEDGFAKAVGDNAVYDALSIVMSMVYQKEIRSEFYERMFQIYKAGHLPCGWHGKPEKGHFLIY
jgi:hypothetical protein